MPPVPSGESLISLRQVTKNYRTAAGVFQALKGIDLEVYPGEFVGVIGKSGAGKTTLVNMITGVDRITAGDVQVAGTPVQSLDENRLALWRGLNLGVIYQSFQLMPTLSLLDNVLLPMDFLRVVPRTAECAARLRAALFGWLRGTCR